VPAWAVSTLAAAPDPPALSPATSVPAKAWEPLSAVPDDAAVPSTATWLDRADVGPPTTGAALDAGVASAPVDTAGLVAGLPPELPETATGALVEIAVASPVSPLLEAEELAVAGPELPDVAVGLDTTLEPPPSPPPELPVPTLPPPVDWAAAAENAGDAKNRTVATAADVATHETIDRRRVASAITRASAVEQACEPTTLPTPQPAGGPPGAGRFTDRNRGRSQP